MVLSRGDSRLDRSNGGLFAVASAHSDPVADVRCGFGVSSRQREATRSTWHSQFKSRLEGQGRSVLHRGSGAG